MLVQLGNTAPHEVLAHDDVRRRGLKLSEYPKHSDGKVIVPADVDGEQVTTVGPFPDGTSSLEAAQTVIGLWSYHSSQAPTWVASDSDGLAGLLAEHFGCDAVELQTVEG